MLTQYTSPDLVLDGCFEVSFVVSFVLVSDDEVVLLELVVEEVGAGAGWLAFQSWYAYNLSAAVYKSVESVDVLFGGCVALKESTYYLVEVKSVDWWVAYHCL